MRLILNDEQSMMATTAQEFVEANSPMERVRQLRDAKDPVGFSKPLWKEMAGLGWLGVHLPETVGGSGLGFFELCILLEAAGRRLMPEPFVSTILLGAQALLLGGTEEQRARWLPSVVGGDSFLSVAYQEKLSRYDIHHVGLRAQPDGDGYVLHGEKSQVLDGHVADAVIVAARTEGDSKDPHGITLFLVEASSPGVEITRGFRVDGRNGATVRFGGVRVTERDVVGGLHRGGDLLSRVVDIASIGLAAEMVGAATQAFEDTLAYLKERVQFGVSIGSFQALQHRAARLFTEVSLARSAMLAAASTVDENPDGVAMMASLVKSQCSDTFVHVSHEGVQMHGGVGVTDEYDIGLFLKRARATDVLFGDSAWHRRRWAGLSGY